MSTSIRALYALKSKGSTYCYFPSYHNAERATNILHEVVITNADGKATRTDVDFTHNHLMSRNSFLKWIEMGMPDREEYSRVFSSVDEEDEVLVPLNAAMIDELFRAYKHE